MSILDLSKTPMYDFHYNYIKKKYSKKAKLLFTDTDSLCYEIEIKDVHTDFWKDKDKFYFSDYNETSKFYDKRLRACLHGGRVPRLTGLPG